jgi:hypothetical protein
LKKRKKFSRENLLPKTLRLRRRMGERRSEEESALAEKTLVLVVGWEDWKEMESA